MKRILTVVLAAWALGIACQQRSAPAPPRRSSAAPPPVRDAADVVREFGRRLKNVSLLAPWPVAVRAIRANYADLVEPDLLAKWLREPGTAPGRQTSSPWPDRIDIDSEHRAGSDHVAIDGKIVEVTSAGPAGETPVHIELTRTGGRWLISDFRAIASAPSLSPDQRAAVRVLQQYYEAIAAHDYQRAYRMWGDTGPPHQSYRQFVAGFSGTATVRASTGAPGRIGAAAGSVYIEVPVVVDATTSSGARQRFEGSYTMRKSNVDGATAAQRAWHIYSASIHTSPNAR